MRPGFARRVQPRHWPSGVISPRACLGPDPPGRPATRIRFPSEYRLCSESVLQPKPPAARRVGEPASPRHTVTPGTGRKRPSDTEPDSEHSLKRLPATYMTTQAIPRSGDFACRKSVRFRFWQAGVTSAGKSRPGAMLRRRFPAHKHFCGPAKPPTVSQGEASSAMPFDLSALLARPRLPPFGHVHSHEQRCRHPQRKPGTRGQAGPRSDASPVRRPLQSRRQDSPATILRVAHGFDEHAGFYAQRTYFHNILVAFA